MKDLSLERNNAQNIACFFKTNLPLLFIGETGTGKSHSAGKIHKTSIVGSGPFMPLNCAGISESLVESTLFGSIEGAFTGAKNEPGFFGRSEDGTIFLDEIGELSLGTQAKLLQILSDRTYSRVGSSIVRKTNARIICATNVDLKENVKKGSFREDLYYRISVLPVYLRPLRERRCEIPNYVMKFVFERNLRITSEAMVFLIGQDWIGNLRQLFSCLEIACEFCSEGTISLINVQNAYEVTS